MQLKEMVATSDNIVFFGGAGVSTESGIPDFRSVDGLYHQKFRYPPETILSHTFYERHKEEFFDFYRQKLIAPKARPNAAHVKLAQWERDVPPDCCRSSAAFFLDGMVDGLPSFHRWNIPD